MQLAAVHGAAKAQYERRAADLEARCARLVEDNRALEVRRSRDVEGYLNDISLLRKQLSAIDRKLLQMRLVERLDDDERLDRLLDQLESKVGHGLGSEEGEERDGEGHRGLGPAGRPGSAGVGSVGGGSVKSAMSHQLRAARGKLASLEEELQRKKAALRRR